MITQNQEGEVNKILVTDEFLEWEERDTAAISLFKHCIAGK